MTEKQFIEAQKHIRSKSIFEKNNFSLMIFFDILRITLYEI
jgi:hypothetical protein